MLLRPRSLDLLLRAPDGVEGGGAPVAAEVPAPAAAAPAAEPTPPAAAPAPKSEPSLLAGADGKAQAEPDKTPAPEPAKTEGKEPAKAPEPEKKAEPTPEPAARAEEPPPPEPIKYEPFTLPEGIKLDDGKLKAFQDYAGSKQIPQDVAQGLVDQYVKDTQDFRTQMQREQQDYWSEQQNKWKSEFRADPELGGRREATTLATAKAVVETYGGSTEQRQQLMAALDMSGMGNHPAVIRFLHNIGKNLNVHESGIVPANPGAQPAQGSTAKRWYGETMKVDA